MLETKNTATGKNVFDELIDRLDTAQDRTSELDSISRESTNMQNKIEKRTEDTERNFQEPWDN